MMALGAISPLSKDMAPKPPKYREIITTLQSGLIDDLAMTYQAGTNKLSTVADNGQADMKHLGFNQVAGSGATAHSYDESGNITYDYSKRATIAYNHLNIPSTISFQNRNIIEYRYDATGKKITTTRKTSSSSTAEIQHCLGGIEYKQQVGISNYRLEAIYHPEGRLYNTNITNLSLSTIAFRNEFCIKDHLGNTRLTFADKNNNGQIDVTSEILQENHYYPFGMNMGGPWMNDLAANDKLYQYNGKQLESFGGLGCNDYGARWYDASVGRWSSVDPLADKYPGWSSYNYTLNNPMNMVDPDGMEATGDIYNLKGVHIGNDGVEDQKVYLNLTSNNRQLNQAESAEMTRIAQEATGVSNTLDVTALTGLTNDELNVRSTLSTIMQVEAGRLNPPLNYNSWFGTGNVFTSDSYESNPKAYAKHPGMHLNPKGSAAGAYQFLERYYTGTDFSPFSQDKAAIGLMGKKGLSLAKSGDIVEFGSLMGSTQKWTSFPNWTNAQLKSEFNKSRVNELSGSSRVGTPLGQLLPK
jgi:RHS repeat-associated protein